MELKDTIRIGNKNIGIGFPPYIVAEMACAHDGSFDKAKELVNSAANAEADCVQFQFFVAEETVTPQHEAYPVIKDIEFTERQWKELFDYAKSKNLDVFACTYDTPSVKLAKELGVDGIKLNSADLSNPEVVQAVAKSGLPFTLGTGASTLDEISAGLEEAKKYEAQKVILMQGVQNFPTEPKDLNIAKITLLKEQFDIPVGYADHTSGDDPFAKVVDLVAVGLGANLLEKHITIDRTEKGIDYQAALEPNEFKEYVRNVRQGYLSFGDKEIKPFSDSDLKYRKFQKKSIVAAKDLSVGDIIDRSNVNFIRNTNPGLPPSKFESIQGKKVLKAIKKFQNLNLENLV